MEAERLGISLRPCVGSSASPSCPPLDMLKWSLKFCHSATHLLSLNHRIRWGLLSKGNTGHLLLEAFSDRPTVSKWNYRKICRLFLHNSLPLGAPGNQKGSQEEAWIGGSLNNSLISFPPPPLLPHSTSTRHESSCLPFLSHWELPIDNSSACRRFLCL